MNALSELKVVDKNELCNQDAIILNLIKIKGYQVIIYGAGAAGYSVSRQLDMYGIKVNLFIDKDIKKCTKNIRNIEVIHIGQAAHYLKSFNKYFFIIAVDAYSSDCKLREEIDKFIQSTEAVGAYQLKFFPRAFEKFDDYILKHEDEIAWLQGILADKESRITLNEWIRVLLQADSYLLEEHKDRYKYWGCDFQGKDELYRHLANEVFVNCGSCNGDTIFKYIAKGYPFERIYAYEGNEKVFERLKNNIELLDVQCRNKIELHNEYIGKENEQFREYLTNRRVTLINADIEGNELDVLQEMEEIIIEQEPVIAFCVYHLCDDFIKIPKFVLRCNSKYKIYFRKYVSNLRSKAELVMYAIPVNRCLK